MPRAVLDTNIYVSGILFGGKPGTIVDLAREGEADVYISQFILNEIEKTFRDKFNQPEYRIQEILLDLKSITNITIPKVTVNEIKDCEPDNRILECAFECEANYIVSGDKHLLKLGSYKGIKILKPKEFITIVLP